MSFVKTTAQYSTNELIRKILQGDIALFELIIRRYNPYLYKSGRAYGFGHEDTQDLMQETFISAFQNLSKFEFRSLFKTWIIKIMLRHCSAKKQKFSQQFETASLIHENALPMFTSKNANDGNKEATNRELNYMIEQALAKLPSIYSVVFVLREIDGLSIAETAEALDITESNVKVRLNRAKTMLRKEIEKNYSPKDIYDFNLVYCDAMVERVMREIVKLSN